jgi:hypothetical protein
MTPGQQLIGDLYVLAGLLGLGVTAAVLILAWRREQRVVTPATTYQGASTGASTS